MAFTNKTYTNILKNGLSDAKLKYFNVKDYFDKQKVRRKYYLSVQDISTQFTLDKFSYSVL